MREELESQVSNRLSAERTIQGFCVPGVSRVQLIEALCVEVQLKWTDVGAEAYETPVKKSHAAAAKASFFIPGLYYS